MTVSSALRSIGQAICNSRIDKILVRSEYAFQKPIASLRPQVEPASMVDYDAMASDGKLQFDGQFTSTVAQIREVQVTAHRMEWSQCSQIIQVFNTVHVTRVQNKIHISKDIEDFAWQMLHPIGQVRIGEDADGDSISAFEALRHESAPLVPS